MNMQQLLSRVRRADEQYGLIKDGDVVAVGVSGGKDSLALMKLLSEYKRFSPGKFELMGVSIDLKFGGKETDFSPIENFAKEINVPYYIERTEIGQIVFDARKEKSPCALCSKMRKGALYERAKKEGANKVALGHHADDLIDTFMLSLLYEGRLNTFSPKSYLSRTGVTLIRPLIMISESDIAGFAKTLPVCKSRCPVDKHTEREYVKTIYSSIGEKVKNVREMVYTALTHPERYNLFDKFLSKNETENKE